jgi:hypothetical protein
MARQIGWFEFLLMLTDRTSDLNFSPLQNAANTYLEILAVLLRGWSYRFLPEAPVYSDSAAEVAALADAQDLTPCGRRSPGFNSTLSTIVSVFVWLLSPKAHGTKSVALLYQSDNQREWVRRRVLVNFFVIVSSNEEQRILS